MRSFKRSEYIFEEMGGTYGGFGYLRLVSDVLDLATLSKRDEL